MRAAHWSSRFPNGQFERKSRAFRLSLRGVAAHTFSCRASRHCNTSRPWAVAASRIDSSRKWRPLMSSVIQPPRTYNQNHLPRKYTRGKRRVSIYWTWSYPWETNRDLTEMDNRFSTMTEVRRVEWPNYESIEFSEKMFLQGIAGTLELFHLGLLRFQQCAGEITGHPVAVYQRIDQAGQKLPLDDRVLEDTDTLMVFGLDHMVTEQEAAQEEI